MLNTTFTNAGDKGLQLLFLGAHCDDIEIGCGGTLLRLVAEYDIKQVTWVVFTSNETRKKEAIASAEEFLGSVKNRDIRIYDFKDGYLPANWSNVKDKFEAIKDDYSPDITFTHYRNDLHQDHRIINELTWNTFRNHLILEYEIAKYDGDLGNPNFFVPLSTELLKRKNSILTKCFKSQLNKQWFDVAFLNSVTRIRGVECVAESGYAEAFFSRKIII